MKLSNKKELETNKWELEITVDGEVFAEAVKKAYQKNAKKINVPGFRRGKAPQGIIEKMYGESVFFDDAVDIVLPEAYEKAIKESELEPVSRPEIEVVSVDKKEGVVVKAIITTKPEISVKNYKGIKAKKVVHTVTEQEVMDAIDKIRERNGRSVVVEDRGAKLQDIADINFEGFVDDVAFSGGKGDNFSLTLGSGQFIPGFEEQIVGHKTGEEFDVTVTFPQEYHAEELAGKEAVFKVKINELKATELPELDDEFVKDVSELDTVKEYKASIREELEKKSDQESTVQLENSLIDVVLENMTGEIPQVMFEHRIEDEIRGFENRLTSQGMNMDTYLQYTGMTLDGLRSTFRENSEKQVTIRLALEKIAELESIQVSEEEIEKERIKLSTVYNIPMENVQKLVPTEDLIQDASVSKAIKLICDSAEVEEVAETLEEVKKADSVKTATKEKAPTKEKAEASDKIKKVTPKKSTAKKDAVGKPDKK